MRTSCARGLVVAGALAVASPASAAPAADQDDAPAVEDEEILRIDAAALGSGLEPLVEGIREQAGQEVRGRDPAPGRVTIELTWLDTGSFAYSIRVVVESAASGVSAITNIEACRQCTSDELVETVVAALKEALDDARAAADEAASAERPVPATEPSRPVPATPTDAPRRKRLTPMGWSGVGLLGAGVAGVATGATFVALHERPARSFPTKLRDYRPPGIATLAVGGGLLVTGAILVALDLHRSRRLTATPLLGPRGAAVTLGVTF